MADNDPAAPHPELEPGPIHEGETKETRAEPESAPAEAEALEEKAVTSDEEPRVGASEQVTAPSDETEQGAVTSVPEQGSSPKPPGDGVPSTAEEHSSPTETTQETVSATTPTIVAPTPAKRFTSMNINKKFLAKTAATAPSASSSASAPKAPVSTSAARLAMPNPATPSRLVTKKLTTITPAPSASGGWSLRATPPASLSSSPAPADASAAQSQPSAKPPGPVDALKRPTLVSSTSGLSTDSRPSRDQSPVKAWGSVAVPVADLGRNLQDFPTAAEAAADHSEVQVVKRPSVSTVQGIEHPDAPTHTEEGDARDSFRGIHLDPKAHHWDEMEDESNDFLGDVIEFGDGKTYTVPPEEEEKAAAAAAVSKESRFGDDYDRSWPRSRPLAPDSDGAHAGQPASQISRFPPTHGLPPRQPPGDGRVLFNERSNRMEPARLPAASHTLAPASSSHIHGAPHSHIPPRTATRRNSALSASERPKMGNMRDPPPHARDPPPHAVSGAPVDNRVRRPSDARSVHSPVERRSSFLHDEERMRRGESGSGFHTMRRETSRDSRISTGERQPWGVALHRTTSQRTATDAGEPALTSPGASDGTMRRSLLSPSQQVGTLPTIPSPQVPNATIPAVPEASTPALPPVVLNAERENFMKQAAERARRRKLEEETAREEARERAKKKAAELEALSKATLVSASPLVALTRKSSATGLSSGAKSPVPKSPSVSPAVLPTPDALASKPKEDPEPVSIAATVSSWRAKPKPEPEPPAPEVLPPVPATAALEGMKSIEEIDQADGPVEVMDFSDMGKLAGVNSVPEVSRRKPSMSGDFADEAPSSRRSTVTQPPFTHWDRGTRNERTSGDHSEGRPRAPSGSFKHSAPPNRPPHDKPMAGAPNLVGRSSFKEAPISALDDVMSRIKGVLTGMHADNEKPAAITVQHSAVAPVATHGTGQATARANSGVASHWKGDAVTSWRDSSNKRQPSAPLAPAQPTEPFATTRIERPDSPPPAWNTFSVHLNKSTVARPPMPKKQAQLAKLPPMPVRWDILTWDPPVERMSTRTLSRDETFFPRLTTRGVLSAVVNLPSTNPKSEAQSAKSRSPVQRTRLTLMAGPDSKPPRSPNVPMRTTPKGPAFSETQWRKTQVTSPLQNTLELQTQATEETQLETTSRSPPPYHTTLAQTVDMNTAPDSEQTSPKQPDVAFHRSLHEKRPSAMSSVSFTVSSELDSFVVSDAKEDTLIVVSGTNVGLEEAVFESEIVDREGSVKVNGGVNSEKVEQVASGDVSLDKTTQSPTPNSSILLTPPIKVTPPWQSSNPRLPDQDHIKSMWHHASPKDGASTENSLRGLPEDFPSSIPRSVQEMKAEEEIKSSREPIFAPPARAPHNAHRGFQQVPTSPVPMQMLPGYPNAIHLSPGQAGMSRPMPVSSFSLPPPAPQQLPSQPSPYAPYVHPTPPALMYTIPPSRIAPSPAPGAHPMWMQNQAYGRPSPPAGMYPTQSGHNMPYGSPVSQMPPSMSKPQVVINGNHGHHPMSPAMSHPMHMTNSGMAHVGHMGSPHLGHGAPHMQGGPQHMYPGMNSPGGMGMGGNMPYGVQRPAPTMMQQSPMQGPIPNGYGMSPSSSFGPSGYNRANVRSPADGMPHHMVVPHPQHAPMSPGAYHPSVNGYGRSW